MKFSPRFVVVTLAILIWIVVGWPFSQRYHPIAEGFFEVAFLLSVFLGPILLDWLDRRWNQKPPQSK